MRGASLEIAPYPWLVGFCRAPGCGIPMISGDRAAKLDPAAYDGWGIHDGHGYCGPHHYRFTRYGDPLGSAPKVRKPPIIKDCPKCSARVVDPRRLEDARKIEPTVVIRKGRGMCRPCYNSWYKESTRAGTFERATRPYDETLDEWVMLRDTGCTDVATAARRLGMTKRALEQTLYRARKRGDIRGSLVAFSHDMRRAA